MPLKQSVYLNPVFDEGSYVERVERVAAAGASGYEFWVWDRDDRDEIVRRGEELGLELTYLTGSVAPMTDPTNHRQAVEDIEEAIEIAEAVDCERIHPPVGPRQSDIEEEEQHESIVAVLNDVVDTAGDAGVTIVIEPRNTIDHPEFFLNTTEQAYEIIDAIDEPVVQLLFDIYHEQLMRGNIIRNIRQNVDKIGHVHVADIPSRAELGTGELNFENVLSELVDAGYDGYVCCEFRPNIVAERAIRDAGDIIRSVSD